MAWKDGHERQSRLPKNWQTLRRRVLHRDKEICQGRKRDGSACLARANHVDHIERGDNHSLDNLQSLCADCHARKTSREANEVRAQLPNKRPPERHPGLSGGPTLEEQRAAYRRSTGLDSGS
jgi:5-methylcytosine-specific restriction endonuclease McrA